MSRQKYEPVHLIMPHFNGKYDIIRAVRSITERTTVPYVLTIIDDCSNRNDEGYDYLRYLANQNDPKINVVFNSENVGVTKNLNKGFFNYYEDLDCVRLDADIEIQSNTWLQELVDYARSHENVGVVSPIGVGTDFMTIQTAGQRIVISPEDNKELPKFQYEVFDMAGQSMYNIKAEDFMYGREVDSCLGCCAFYKREVINKLGGVDEGYFGWVEDNDFCIGARNIGYKCVVLPQIQYCHHVHAPKRSGSERSKILIESEERFISKWGFSLYEPAPYWKEIIKRYKGTEILWRYNEVA